MWDNDTEAALRPVLQTIRRHSPVKVAIQLAHAGRKASSRVPWEGGSFLPLNEGGWATVGPSALPQKEGEASPAALDEAGLERIRRAFEAATRRAERLGMDAIELHGAHGYLLHEFLSPLANRRTDAYGGSLENRFRFPLEIFDIVRAAFPADKPVGVKLSATDWMPNGWDLEQTVALSRAETETGRRYSLVLTKAGRAITAIAASTAAALPVAMPGNGVTPPAGSDVDDATKDSLPTAGELVDVRSAPPPRRGSKREPVSAIREPDSRVHIRPLCGRGFSRAETGGLCPAADPSLSVSRRNPTQPSGLSAGEHGATHTTGK